MKLGRLMLITVTAVGLGQLVTMTAQAKGGYQRTKTTAIKAKLFYSTSKTGKTYQANRSLTNFKFKANHHLKDYRETAWLATSKTLINVHGKNRLYYYVQNSDLKAQGWVWRGYLKPGKNGFRVSRDMQPKAQNLVMAKPGKIYQFGKNPFNVRFNHSAKLNDKVTYKLTQVWTVYKQAKAYRYYYVVSSDNKVKGWVWHGYLKVGQIAEQVNKPVVNTENASKPVTNSSVNTSVGGTSMGSSSQSQKPGTGSAKPSETVPAWATDDGKRERLVIDGDDFEDYLRSNKRYDLPISVQFWERTTENITDYIGDGNGHYVRKRVTNLVNKVFVLDDYSRQNEWYGFVEGKETRLGYSLKSPILLNGDVLYFDDDFFISVSQPEKHRKYRVKDKNDYVTGAPSWYQYHEQTNDYSIWRYNLRTKQWDETEKHVDHVFEH